jgi:hypothetical protein
LKVLVHVVTQFAQNLTMAAFQFFKVHYACFRGASVESIESLVESNPEWITVRNNAGYLPMQILCKNGRIDE